MPLAFLAWVIPVFPFLACRMDSHVRFLAASPAVFGVVLLFSSCRGFDESNICVKDDRVQNIRPESQGFQVDYSSSGPYLSILGSEKPAILPYSSIIRVIYHRVRLDRKLQGEELLISSLHVWRNVLTRCYKIFSKACKLFVDDDRTSAENGRWVGIVRLTAHVIVNDIARGLIPNLDAELAGCAVDGGQHEAILACAVDRAGSLVLRLGSCNDQPVIRCTLEVQVRDFELELSIAGRHFGALLILRDEAEGGFAGQGWVKRVCPGWRCDPPSTGDKSAVGVIDDHVLERSLCGFTSRIGNSYADRIDSSSRVEVR